MYHGELYVKVTGERRSTVSGEAITELRKLIMHERISLLQEDCCNCRDKTDHATIVLTIPQPDGTTKRIVHYRGCNRSADILTALEDSIDRVTLSEAWTGTKAERARFVPQR